MEALPMHPAARAQQYPSRRLSLVGIAVAAVVVAAAGAGIWDRRREAVQQASHEAAAIAVVVAAETAHSMGNVDRVLRDIAARVRAGDGSTNGSSAWMASASTHDFLRRRLRDLPQADFLALVATDGQLANSARSGPIARADFSLPDLFNHLRNHDATRAYIDTPANTPPDDLRSLFVARRLEGSDGRFLGIALAVVNLDHLEAFYRSIVAPFGGVVRLLRPDGAILGRPTSSASGGRPKLAALQPVTGLDLAVAVTLPKAPVLADWRRHSAVIAFGAAGVALVFLLLLRALAEQSRSLECSEAELRQSEARFRDFALTSSDWRWETDAGHRFVYQSEQIREFGQDPGNRIGRLRIDLAADVDSEPEKWREHMAVLDRHEPFRDFIYERQVGADPSHIISVSGNPAFDAAGRFLGYRGTARDITAEVLAARGLRAAKAAAEAANLAKSHFLANMSHELRTPLNAILGFAELLERGGGGPLEPHGRDYARLIHQSGAHLLAIINELLDLARIDAGKFELHEERGIDPRRLIERCLELVGPQADAGGLRLSVAITEPVPLLVADRTRLTEIVLNLLSNAIKFTEPSGAIAIALRRGSVGDLLFEVSDTGIGMTASEIEIALEPFGQVDPGLSRRSVGTGLGLPLARRFAEMHGGALEIRSEKGAGTTATLILPAARVVDEAVAAAQRVASYG